MAQSTLQIRNRIKTSKNIAQITKAMEMVAASKMRRAQQQAMAGQPYSLELRTILSRLTQQINPELHPLLRHNPTATKRLIVVITSDKGLAGGLNTNLLYVTQRHVSKQTADLSFITIGKKGRDYIAKRKYNLIASFTGLGDRPSNSDITPIAHLIMDNFITGEYSGVDIIYPEFISTLTQKPHIINLLPLITPEELTKEDIVEISSSANTKYNIQNTSLEYTFEPSPSTILDWLLPYYVENRLYQLVLESAASEHSARMVAMKNARESASDLVSALTLLYNRARQAKVTNELLDAYSARVTIE